MSINSYSFKFFSAVCLAASFLLTNMNIHASSTVRVFTGKTGRSLPHDVERFFRICDQEVAKILPSRKKLDRSIEYSIIAVDKGRLKNGLKISNTGSSKFRMFFSDDMTNFKKNEVLLAELAAIIILKKAKGGGDKAYRSIPKWIVYGILRKVLRRMRKSRVSGMVVYPGIHALILGGNSPDMMKTIDKPLLLADGPAREISLEVSEIALNSVLKLPKGKTLIEDIINLSLKGVPSSTSFRGALSDSVKAIERGVHLRGNSNQDFFSLWLGQAALRSSVNIFNPLDATSAEREFLKYSKVRYMTKTSIAATGLERPPEERCCVLRDLGDEIKKMADPEVVLKTKQRDLALLMLMLPSDLQAPVDKMRLALSSFSDKQHWKIFKKKYSLAEAEFYDALDKRQKIEAFVAGIEHSVVPPSYLYAPQLSQIDRYRAIKGKLCPDLQSFMDATEKKIDR